MSKRQSVFEADLYRSVAESFVDRNFNVLDFGCGEGTQMDVFRGMGAREVVGLEVEEKFRSEDVVIEVDTISYLIKNPAKFDVILARESLYYLPRDKQSELFVALHGALKPNGKLIAICFNGVLTTSRYIYQKDFGMRVIFNEISMEELSRNAGFRKLEIYGVTPRARTALGQIAIYLLDGVVRIRSSFIHFLERRRDPFFPKVFTRSIALVAEK